MITIEVLVALLILFTVIVTSVTSVKHLFMIEKQKTNYEKIYMSVLNIKSQISTQICSSSQQISGNIGDVSYSAKCTPLKKMRNYQEKDEDSDGGNIGKTEAMLAKVKISLMTKNFNKEYEYLKFYTRRLKY